MNSLIEAMGKTSGQADDSNRRRAVHTHDLTKSYGDFVAVNGLSLSISEGTIYGLLGPNGAGKTTTVRILCGLTKQNSGEATIFGKPAGKQTSNMVGYMPQDLALYLELSVLDNIKLYGKLAGLKGPNLLKKAEELLKLVGLSERMNAPLSSLSGGMKRKISLVCALIHNPKLLILDEPTVGVDPLLRATLWDYFNNIKKSGSTIILTTHYMDEAMRCDVVGFINSGKLIAEGTPDFILQSTGAPSLEEAFLFLSSREAQ